MPRRNIKITDEVFSDHNERRKALGLSWTEYLRRCAYDPDRGTATDDRSTDGINTDEVAEAVAERIDYAAVEAAARRGTEAALPEAR